MDKSFDLVLWGATGFTGKLVAAYLAKQYGVESGGLRWAIAGRNPQKLDAVRRDLARFDASAANLPLLVADSLDRGALDKMVAQTRVVCSTVGPYALYGTPLVASCVEHGVDYCDLTGEVQWIRQNVDAFHAQAEETGARIVHCCGFDSIPSDLGTLMLQEYAQQEYGRSCSEIKFFLAGTSGGFSGGTIASLLNVLEAAGKDRSLRRVLADPFSLVPDGNPTGERVQDQVEARWDEDVQRWTGPFVMAMINTRIVRRSNYLLDYAYGRDFQYSESTLFRSGFVNGRLTANGFAIGFGALMGLASFAPARSLLQKTVLPAPGEGPSAETRENGYFRVKLLGKIPAQDEQPAVQITGEVAGTSDPGYGETAKMLGESALCLALDKEDTRQQGGVLTPAATMGMRLVERLRQAGMTFAVTREE